MPRGRRRYSGITTDVFASVIRKYLTSDKFHSLAPATQDNYRRFLLLAERREGLGSVPIEEMRPALAQAFLDGLSATPGSQKVARGALVALERWAMVRDLLPRQITLGVEIIGGGGGHIPWTDEQVAYAEQNVRPHFARFVTLGANLGQRGSDIVRMRWTDIETVDGIPGINVIQKKTKLEVWIPLTQHLQAAMAHWERRPGFILTRPDGRPFSRPQLSDGWIEERRHHAPLRDLVLHGLRGTAVVRLRRAGATIPQIADFVGMSEGMVRHYTRKSEQRQNAIAAVLRLEGTAGEHKRDKHTLKGS